MSLAQKSIRQIFQVIASIVEKNHLFEQPNERSPQPPLQEVTRQREDAVFLSDTSTLVQQIQESSGWLFVHHWASWCDGCMEELSDIHQWIQQLAEQGIESKVLSWELFNGTPPQHALPVVRHIHQSNQLCFSSFIVTGAPEDFFTALDLAHQQIPQSSLYKDGRCVFSHLGILSTEAKEIMRTHMGGAS